jgi:hypothetical protein
MQKLFCMEGGRSCYTWDMAVTHKVLYQLFFFFQLLKTPFAHRSTYNMIYCFLPCTFFLLFDLVTGTRPHIPPHLFMVGWCICHQMNGTLCTGPLMPDCSTDPDSSDHTV